MDFDLGLCESLEHPPTGACGFLPAQDGELLFQRFCAGQDVTKGEVERLLNTVGVKGQIRRLRYGYYRKIIAWLEQGNGAKRIAKITLHPYSTDLLRQEARGHATLSSEAQESYLSPNFLLAFESSNCGVALMDEVSGAIPKPWHFPSQPLTKLMGVRGYMGVKEYLESLLASIKTSPGSDTMRELSTLIQQRFGEQLLPLSASHGDFVYWNLLQDRHGDNYLLDFEYFSQTRSACFDEWHWFVFPLGRKALRLRLNDMMAMLTPLLPRLLWNGVLRNCYQNTEWLQKEPIKRLRLLLAIYLFEQVALMCREHQLPDIIALIGLSAYSSRYKLLRLYGTMIERLSL